jgi:hypothetical protein
MQSEVRHTDGLIITRSAGLTITPSEGRKKKKIKGPTMFLNCTINDEGCNIQTLRVVEKEPKTDVITLIPDYTKDSPLYYIEIKREAYLGQDLNANEFLAIMDENGHEEIYCALKAREGLVNNMIDRGFCTDIDRTLCIMNTMNEAYNELGLGNHTRNSFLCASCGVKIGVKKCSGCSSLTRYCSKECQYAHWPLHKKICSGGVKKLII